MSFKCQKRFENKTSKKRDKISVKFFKNHLVRALWNDDNSKWYFSVLDVVGAIREEDDYTKNRNYWKCLKAKFKEKNPQLVSSTIQLKLEAKDGKKLLETALTDKIDDREIFMKGIDYSYYYEEID